MAYQAVFKRYEMKYLLTLEQKARVLTAMAPYMALDKYGRTVIRNVYLDTPDFRLIRRSLEKPLYKEKIRIRSYRQASPESQVFVELKKKYKGVVYKRRLSMEEGRAVRWVEGEFRKTDSQIAREIDWFLSCYPGLAPRVFLSYEREAYFCRQGGDLRITFDDNILAREDRLSLEEPPGGRALLEPGTVLMEVKTAGGLPLWLTAVLTEERIFKTSFSKYGKAYSEMIYPQNKGDFSYA